MAFSTTVKPMEKPATVPSTHPSSDISDALLSMVILSIYGAQMSKKTVRKLKRRFFFTSLKLKAKSFFSPKRDVSDRQLLYIIAGAVFVALLFISPVAALAIALLVLILILAGVV